MSIEVITSGGKNCVLMYILCFSARIGDRKLVCLRVRLEVLVAVLRKQGRHIDIILSLVEEIVALPAVVPVCLYKIGSLGSVHIVDEEKNLSERMEKVWSVKDETTTTGGKTSTVSGSSELQTCYTCFKVEEDHDRRACKIREEARIMIACKEIEDMIDRNRESVTKLERVESDLLMMLHELEMRPKS